MAFLGNIFRSFISSEEPSPTTVLSVPISKYLGVPVVCRDESLSLYGPTSNKKYDLLLQMPVEDSRHKAFSLFRLSDSREAQTRFFAVKDVLLPLIDIMPTTILNVVSLQTLCNVVSDNPSWSVCHVVAHLGYVGALAHPHVQRFCDTAEMSEKKTPLLLAVEKQDTSMIKALLSHHASLDQADCKGNTVYHLAAVTNKLILDLLSTNDRNILNFPNAAGKTPLHLACEGDKPECVKALLSAGADVNVAATHDSSLPIHSAIKSNSTLCAKEIIQSYPNQLNAEDMKQGGTPLHWATSREMINALVELGCKLDAANFRGATALHNMVARDQLPCVVAILSWDADVNRQDVDGNTALHLVSSVSILQAILVSGADTSILNKNGHSARHILSTGTSPNKHQMLYIMHAIGVKRCTCASSACNDGCSFTGKFDGIPPDLQLMDRCRKTYDEFLDNALCGLTNINNSQNFQQSQQLGFSSFNRASGGRILCLDGGGIKGLVLIQLLMVIQKVYGGPIKGLFDWIAGTSTGGILALAIAAGKSPKYCQGLYFRLKDKVFVGSRPYDEKPLEDVLRNEFGEKTTMSEIKDINVCVTGVLADRFPADLHLFRNYKSGQELLSGGQISGMHGYQSPLFKPTQPHTEQLVWQAARSSGAAPSYFKAYGRFIDGGLVGNNPSLDMLTEITELNTVLKALGRMNETVTPQILLSLGTGKPPLAKIEAIDVFRPDSFFKTVQMAFGLSNMAKLLIDQVTMADNSTVDRCRAWCGMAGVSYLRLSPLLSLDLPLDEIRDDVLVNMLWETYVYACQSMDRIQAIVDLLKSHNSNGQPSAPTIN